MPKISYTSQQKVGNGAQLGCDSFLIFGEKAEINRS